MNIRHKGVLARGVAGVAGATLVIAGVAAPASAQSGVRDLMFSIDTTGSMAPYIAQTKTAVDDLASDLASESAGTRVGLAEYRDAGDAFQARTVTDLTSDLPTFRTGLDGLNVGGGGDIPESVYSGIAQALCQAWNPSAVKAIIVVGDAPAKDPEPVTGLTEDKVIALANGTSTDNPYCAPARMAATAAAPAGSKKIFVVTANSELTEQFQRIAEETGGATVAVDDTDKIGDAIKDAVGTIDDDIDPGGGLIGSLKDLFGSSGS